MTDRAIRRYWGLLWLFFPFCLTAQNVQALTNRANRRLNEGKTAEAAALYEKAGRLAGSKPELMLKAAECYSRLRDYVKTADCYHAFQSGFDPNTETGLLYARALKQSGQYNKAAEAFREFGRNYTGENKASLIPEIQTEIKGCEMAARYMPPVDSAAASLLPYVLPLPPAVNGTGNEIAPIPFSDKLLYFAVLDRNAAIFMRAAKKDNVWQAAEKAGGLPEELSKHFGTGSFSADGKRFFCSQCMEEKTHKNGNGPELVVRCALYVLRHTDEGWSTPQRLSEYINPEESSNMHPWVAQQDGKELLFFVSDRPGGLGGRDIYRCERPLNSETMDFSLPQNLGPQINTRGDELSPFYDALNRVLWFSSNGQVSLGGLDIFSSNWEENNWTRPRNPGFPLNSPADDLFYVEKKNGAGAYFVSNRSFGNVKTTTFEQDIFEYFPNAGSNR